MIEALGKKNYRSMKDIERYAHRQIRTFPVRSV